MKTNSKDVANNVKYWRNHIQILVRDYLFSKMTAWSMQHLINPGFKIEVTDNVKVIPYNKKFSPKADEWDAQVSRIAKWIGREPSKIITKERMEATFFICTTKHVKNDIWGIRWAASIYIYITSVNSEDCEIEEVEEVVKRQKLTGYCAALETKKYLTAVNISKVSEVI